MKANKLLIAAALSLVGVSLWSTPPTLAEDGSAKVVRLAELEIDPAQLAAYTAALREEIQTSIRREPGVLTLYAVSVKGEPNQIRLFKTYASPAAYQAHLQSQHFKRYKTITATMVKSLKLIETEPLLLAAK